MRHVVGRAADPTADRRATRRMLERASETDEPAFRAWTPHRQVAFGRRDSRAEGYERARAAAERRGFASLERSVGGRAVAYTGSTLAFAHAVPLENPRHGLDDRYDAAVDGVRAALSELGVEAMRGEPERAFCPGQHSVQAPLSTGTAGKVAGIAQRITSGAALVAGCVLVDDRAVLADVLTEVYRSLEQPFDPDSVGTVAAAGGPGDPGQVRVALENAFLEPSSVVESVDTLLEQ